MADDTNEIQISITLDDGSVRQGFARIQQSGEEASSALGDAFAGARNELLGFIAAYVGFEAVKGFLEDSIKAAENYETSLNNMTKSLSAAGLYSQSTAASFVGLADSIEATTTTSATQALQLESLALNYAHTADQAKALTKASIDLSAATGKSVNSAMQQLGQTLEGHAGRLEKLIPSLRNLTKYELESGAAVDAVAARFKDAASGDLNTFDGQIKKMSNGFESLQISIGQFITNSPLIKVGIQVITQEFQKLAEMFKNFSNDQNFLKQLSLDAIDFGKALNDVVIYPLELFYNTGKLVFDAVGAAIADFGSKALYVFGTVIQYFKADSPIAKGALELSQSLQETMKDLDESTSKAFENLGDSKWTDGITSGLDKIRTAVQNTKGGFAPLKQDLDQTREDMLKAALASNTVSSSFKDMGRGIQSSVADMVENSAQKMQQLGATAINSLGGGMAKAMAEVGKAAVQGKDIFKAFAGAMISALGGALVQMGAGYIMIGLAREIASYGADATGYELIGIGSGMAALGGVLEAVGGNVSGSSSSSASGSTSGAAATASSASGDITANPATAVQAAQQHATINIQGSVFDTKETGLRIVELVNQAFTGQGVSVVTA